jgi:hypothetical protein
MCRDGSIQGGEAVSIPLSGAKGLQNMKHIGEELTKRVNIDINCAYHLHIGNIPTTRIYLVALYMLGYAIQDELFKMFPYYKTNPQGIKRKNYCQKLNKMSIYSLKDQSKEGYEQFVDVVYNKIFEFLSDGRKGNTEVTSGRGLPISHKWQNNSRYFFLNLVNLLFSKRRTAEYRISSPTTNPQRIINWLFICVAITRYAQYNMKSIISGAGISLEDVLNFYKNHWKGDKDAAFLSDYLIAYYKERKAAFEKDFKNGDFISAWEIEKDKNYKFTYQGVTELF